MKAAYERNGVTLYHGDVMAVLPTLPAGSVQCVVTSPPYFALRSYLPKSDPLKPLEIGSEPTPEAFIQTMVAVFREVRRILRDDGTLFINLGDSYSSLNMFRDSYIIREDLTEEEKSNAVMEMFGVRFEGHEEASEGALPQVLPPEIHSVANGVGPALQVSRIESELRETQGASDCVDAGETSQTEVGRDRELGREVRVLRGESTGVSDGGPHQRRRRIPPERVNRKDQVQFRQDLQGHSESGLPEIKVPCPVLQLQLRDRLLGILSAHTFAYHEIPDSARFAFSKVAVEQPGNLLNMPHRVAEALRADGWIWRQTIVWSKRNPLPESVSGWRWVRCRVKVDGYSNPKDPRGGFRQADRTRPERDGTGHRTAYWSPCPGCQKCEPHGGYVLRRGSGRCTTAHEYVFVMAKTNRYFWDGEASKEPSKQESADRYKYAFNGGRDDPQQICPGDPLGQRTRPHGMREASPSRNPRSVWTLSSERTKVRHFACVDSETECLTVNGWKRYDELAVGEMAAQYDLDTRRLSWGAIEAVATYHVSEQEMVVGRGRDFDFWLTPNHRCVVVNRRGEARIVEASNLNRCHQFPIGGQWEDSGSGPGLEWAELIGWYIAEGHEKKNGLGVELYQSKSDNPEFCQRIENLLLAVEAEYESATYARVYRGRNTLQMAFHVHGFAAAKLRSLCPNKILPHGCLSWSNAECQALLSGLCMGDGSARDGGRITFVQKRKDVSDMVHAMAIRCGLSASMKTDETLNRLYFARRHTRSFRGTNGNGDGLRLERYTGVVWCPKLPLGTWVARRHGRVFITGNTFPSELVRRCLVAGVSAGGCCPHCGAPWAPVVETQEKPPRVDYEGKNLENDPQHAHRRILQAVKAARMNGGSHDNPFTAPSVLGYRPTCDCPPHESTGCLVLDPFNGIGTTGQTAITLGCRYIGIDLNREYLDVAAERIFEPPRWWLRQQKPKAAKKPAIEQGVLFT